MDPTKFPSHVMPGAGTFTFRIKVKPYAGGAPPHGDPSRWVTLVIVESHTTINRQGLTIGSGVNHFPPRHVVVAWTRAAVVASLIQCGDKGWRVEMTMADGDGIIGMDPDFTLIVSGTIDYVDRVTRCKVVVVPTDEAASS